MKKVLNINTIPEYNTMVGQQTFHPLVSVVDFSTVEQPKKMTEAQALNFDFYTVFYKQGKHCDLRYGRNYYDYQEGTLVFIAPGQVISIEEDGSDYKPSGTVLLFHPDLIRGTSLAYSIKDYTFFSYDVHEALHLSEEEKQIMFECYGKIDYEIKRSIDKHSKKLIVSNIELFLNYCTRFYDRQFITRDQNTGVVEKFDGILHEYLQSDKPQTDGIPSVAYFADELHLSANYFGDLIKKETGKSALEHIQAKLIDIAKEKVFQYNKSVSEIAYELGFKYPNHFSRFFKQQVGCSPNEYRQRLGD